MSDLRTALQAIYDDRGKLTPADVVDTARPADHPLHGRFEWDDTAAGEAYRRHQAQQLIRSVKITHVETDGRDLDVRAFLAVRTPTSPSNYVPTEDVAADPFARRLVEAEMRRAIVALEKRYGHLQEFWTMLAERAQAGAA